MTDSGAGDAVAVRLQEGGDFCRRDENPKVFQSYNVYMPVASGIIR